VLISDEGPEPDTADAYLETSISPSLSWISETVNELEASGASPLLLDPTAPDSMLADIAADSWIAFSIRADCTLP
jgi:hypothetical protein